MCCLPSKIHKMPLCTCMALLPPDMMLPTMYVQAYLPLGDAIEGGPLRAGPYVQGQVPRPGPQDLHRYIPNM
jgi:hypothetical protein